MFLLLQVMLASCCRLKIPGRAFPRSYMNVFLIVFIVQVATTTSQVWLGAGSDLRLSNTLLIFMVLQ